MELTYMELSRDEEVKIVKLAKGGCIKAMHALINSITPLIMREAYHWVASGANDGIGVVDLFNEGVLGAYRALETFDETLGFRFGTHAIGVHGMVKTCMRDAVANSHIIPQSTYYLKKHGALHITELDSPIPNNSHHLTYSDIVADKSNDMDTPVEYDMIERDMATIDLNELIDRMPDGIEKTTIRKVANGMTMREIASDTKCSRMMPQRNTEKAIATIQKMINCRS